MAIANLSETVKTYILRRNELQMEQQHFFNQKQLAVYAQADANSLLSITKSDIRAKYKELWESNPDDYKDCANYTEIPDFEAEIEMIEAKFQDELAELSAWETTISNQITTNDTELQEVNAFLESYKGMLSTNIQGDFNYALS